METKSFTYYSHNTMKNEKIDLNENHLSNLRDLFVDRYVDNMTTKDLVEYVYNDMMQYVENQPDPEFLDDCVDYWDDHFEDILEEVKEID